MNPGSRRIAGRLLASVLAVGIAASVVFVAGDRDSESIDAVTEPGRCGAAIGDDDINRQVRLTSTADGVEFELWSSEPFPVRALFPVVRIGSRDFSQGRHGDDGQLNTLIVVIPHEQFDLLSSDDLVWVYYGGAGTPPPLDFVPDGSQAWSFGGFDKDLLDCTTNG